MVRTYLFAVVLAIPVFGAQSAGAQSATQVVRFQVTAVNQIAVSGNPGPLAITSATAGGGLTSVSASGTSYAITTNESNQKIAASIDEVMPAGVTLELSLTPPAGASSAGTVALSTAGADVVTGISHATASGLPIMYRLHASPEVRLPPTSRTVTLTIVAGT